MVVNPLFDFLDPDRTNERQKLPKWSILQSKSLKGGAPNSGRFLIPDKRSFMLDFSETHRCILANLIPQVDLS